MSSSDPPNWRERALSLRTIVRECMALRNGDGLDHAEALDRLEDEMNQPWWESEPAPSEPRQLTSGGVGLAAAMWKERFDLGYESGYRDGLAKATDEIRALRQKVDEQVNALRRAGMTDAERELVAASFETYRFGEESRSFYASLGKVPIGESASEYIVQKRTEITVKGMEIGERWKQAVEAVIKERAPDHESRTTERIRRLNELIQMARVARSASVEHGEMFDEVAVAAFQFVDALTSERLAAVFPLPSGDIEY